MAEIIDLYKYAPASDFYGHLCWYSPRGVKDNSFFGLRIFGLLFIQKTYKQQLIRQQGLTRRRFDNQI